MTERPKALSKEFHHLARVALERKLSKQLDDLATQIALWKDGKLSALDIHKRTVKYVLGPGRAILSQYEQLDCEIIVAKAVADETISEMELSDPARLALAPTVAFFGRGSKRRKVSRRHSS